MCATRPDDCPCALVHFIIATLCFFPLLLSAPEALGVDTGNLVGPGGGGSFFEPTVSPTNAARVLVASDMTGGYFSADRGRSWKAFNLRGRIRFFAFDPRNSKTFYAKSIGLWRSQDEGSTWTLVYPDPDKVTGMEKHGDHAAEKFITKEPQPNMLAVAVDPKDSAILYAAFADRQSTFLGISNDRGKTWKQQVPLPTGTHRLLLNPTGGLDNRDIFAIGRTSVTARLSGKWTELALPSGVSDITDAVVAFSKNKPANLYLLVAGNLHVSKDCGKHWTKVLLPGHPNIRAVAASSLNRNIAYASFTKMREGDGHGRTYLGVARTDNDGTSWKLVRKEAETDRKPFGADWIGEFFGSGYASAPIALAVAPRSPKTVYSTDAGRILRSDNGGEHWTAVYSSRMQDGAFTGIGIEATNSHGVFFDPFDIKRMFIAYTDIGLFRSENGGQSWIPSTDGVPHTWVNTTYAMAFDPAVRGRVWAVMSSVHDLPRVKMFARHSISDFRGGVAVSEDGGRSWTTSSKGMGPSAATDIELDRESSPQARTLYVAACGRGVYKSIDGGKSWTLKNNGITGQQPLAWHLVLVSPHELYLIVVKRGEEPLPGSPDDGALYHSSDGAEYWEKIGLPEGVNAPNGIAVDPQRRDRIYLAAWGRFTNGREEGGGIYLSTDRARSWVPIFTNDQHIFDITLDEKNPRTLYAVGFESTAWKSWDEGISWNRITGYNFKWGQKVTLDPQDGRMIYVSTFGGGVWHGPAVSDKEK